MLIQLSFEGLVRAEGVEPSWSVAPPGPKPGACAVFRHARKMLSSHNPTQFCAGGGSRTLMTRVGHQALSLARLPDSATPAAEMLVAQAGLEPATPCASRRCSS